MQNFKNLWDRSRNWLMWLGLPLLAGILIAAAIPRPGIGILRLEDAIYSYSARDLVAQIASALEQPELRAVVLVLDSPGGTVVDTEAIYMELSRLRAKKPIVTVVNAMAASGAYYLAVNTDYIYAKPSSQVGNIGAIGYLPSAPFIYEDIISTGPYKLWGSPRDAEMRQIELIKQGFYQAVQLGRGDRLQVDPETVLSGRIWSGTDALRLGLIDALGTEHDAVEKAAQLAHVWHYKLIELRPLSPPLTSSASFFIQDPAGVTLPYPTQAGIYLLYIPQLAVER